MTKLSKINNLKTLRLAWISG